MDENGYITIHGRIDDVIQVAGHRLSTKQMEMVISMQILLTHLPIKQISWEHG